MPKRRSNDVRRLFFICLFFLLSLFVAATPSGISHARQLDEYPVVKLRSLDKVTARTMTFEARVGSTVKFGQLFIKVQACRKASPIESPESAAFLQIWEVTLQDKAEWIFSGWMFASSPGLSSMDHPVYDVWVIDCLESQKTAKTKAEVKTPEKIPEEKLE